VQNNKTVKKKKGKKKRGGNFRVQTRQSTKPNLNRGREGGGLHYTRDRNGYSKGTSITRKGTTITRGEQEVSNLWCNRTG